jgi:CRISPR-associated endonuclease/helicase Cas3
MENRERTVYKWHPVTTGAVAAQSLFIALPDELAYYDANIGFALLDGSLPLSPNGYQSTLLPHNKPQNERSGSRQTSYQEHIAGLLRAYRLHIANEVRFVAQRLEHALTQPAGTLDQAIRLAIACHDLGKLNQPWQHWALSWQTLLFEHQQRPAYQLPSPTFCFAKTDYNDSREQREWQREVQPKRPRHACESVAIGRQLIAASLGITKEAGRERIPILRAICGAISRHHSAQASEYGPVQLNTRAIRAASEALQDALQGTSWDYDVRFLETALVTGGDLAPISAFKPKLTRPDPDDALQGDLETLLYFVIVRALRLADQRAG